MKKLIQKLFLNVVIDKFNVYNVVNNGLAASACNKLFKKELISKYKFAEGKVNEDIAISALFSIIACINFS